MQEREYPRKRVMLADDHQLLLEGLSAVLEREYDLVGSATDGRTLVELAERCRPDFVLVDISMPVMNGIEALKRIHATMPDTRVVVVTQHEDRQYMRAAFAAGASGYVLKQSAASELLQALRAVCQGTFYVSPQLLQKKETTELDLRQNPVQLFGAQLTSRQREVVQLVAEGNSAKQIAHILNISTKTVEFHKATIMQQLGFRSTADMIRYAVETGIVRQ
ncbi:MAG TPA: response regulator transcription factor [Bryobacteraceae bacterium]|jgi:DNA-binding NarL/FixJ family response regulator|nr:response regulator transcription factor [Bryobacteraceae bacterium]